MSIPTIKWKGSLDANALTLNGGSITDAADNAATLNHNAVVDNASYKVDTTAPSTTAPTSYVDDVGTITSSTSTASTTDDTTPGLNVGSGLTDTASLYVDGVKVAASYDSANGTLTPTTALSEKWSGKFEQGHKWKIC